MPSPDQRPSSAAYTVKHSGWPFTEENLIGEFVELPRAEHEALLAKIDRLREGLWHIAEATPSSEDAVTLAKAFVLVRGYARKALDRG